MKIGLLVMQLALGFLLCGAIVWGWLYYLPVPWEVTYPDGSQPIGWHSALVAVAILLISQYVSRLIFRQFAH